jgi:hypothetical protein
MSLTQEAKDWVFEDGVYETGKRISWPLERNTKVDLTQFEQYLVSKQGLLADTEIGRAHV